MASNAEMLRLVQHAVAKLDWASKYLIDRNGDRGVLVVVAFGSAILGMVASCMMDDPTPLGPLLGKLRDGTSYPEWAATADDSIGMSDTELDSIARFLAAEVSERG